MLPSTQEQWMWNISGAQEQGMRGCWRSTGTVGVECWQGRGTRGVECWRGTGTVSVECWQGRGTRVWSVGGVQEQ